ncbi:MAG: hypothetical protein WBA13_12465 [Microcoleaceae cyanobacterium]
MNKRLSIKAFLTLLSAPLIMACGSAQTLITVNQVPVARCALEECQEIMKRLQSGETVTVKATNEESHMLLDNEVIYIQQIPGQTHQFIAQSFLKIESQPLPEGKQLLQLDGMWYQKAEVLTPTDQQWLHPIGVLDTDYFPLRGGCEENNFVFGVLLQETE